jgi:hypothetical protein
MESWGLLLEMMGGRDQRNRKILLHYTIKEIRFLVGKNEYGNCSMFGHSNLGLEVEDSI